MKNYGHRTWSGRDILVVDFGKPIHGWLAVGIRFNDFHLDFDASDVLNDPIDELCDRLLKLDDKKKGQVPWWLEPAAYYFELQKNGPQFDLTILHSDDLHNDQAEKRLVHTITGSYAQIIVPLKNAILQFSAQSYDDEHWPYVLDKVKLDKLAGI